MDPRLLGVLAALSQHERVRLSKSLRETNALEAFWSNRFRNAIKSLDERVFRSLYDHGSFAESSIDFLPLILDFSFRVLLAGMKEATASDVGLRRLAKPPAGKIPRSLRTLREMYDSWRKKRKIPTRQKWFAEKLKATYIKRCHSVWEKHSEDFRSGKSFDLGKVRAVLEKADMATARGEQIVRTETTYYYTNGQRKIYDSVSDVTHYVFVAIRDKATTKWCKTRQGLVYAKTDPLLDKETPPIHWNCRSGLLPLTPQNPKHRRLIEDKSRNRRNHQCEPLPPGWNSR